ncbi:hypothetical protein ACN6LL_004663 [Streptomyces violaceoruber]
MESGDHRTVERIGAYLELTDSYPLTDYFQVPGPVLDGFELPMAGD